MGHLDEILSNLSAPLCLPCPKISIVIPLYNAEKYLAKCLDSVFTQTFQSFEVIVVDDCSTDSSCEIVESYIPKFNGRLRLYHMDENTGSGGLPRNKGLSMSSGEYIFFLDADDMFTKTALEELYTLAKEYNVDVVYCERYYTINADGTNRQITSTQSGKLVDTPTLESEDLNERVKAVINHRYWVVPWNKFTKRNLVIDNKIFFPHTLPGEDDVWVYGVVFYAKKLLRAPNIVYIYRASEASVMRVKKTPQQTIKFWTNPMMFGLKSLDNLMSGHEFFKENPQQRYVVLENFVRGFFDVILRRNLSIESVDFYEAIKQAYGERLVDYNVLIPALCTAIYYEKKAGNNNLQAIRKFSDFLTARMYIKWSSKSKGDFKITSLSDWRAEVSKPDWLNKRGVGYVLQSYVGKLTIVAEASEDGKINLSLRGMDIRDPKDKSKPIPYWIDYKKMIVNDEVVFDTLTPAWQGQPYRYNMDVKANEEITIQIEWQPHRSDT